MNISRYRQRQMNSGKSRVAVFVWVTLALAVLLTTGLVVGREDKDASSEKSVTADTGRRDDVDNNDGKELPENPVQRVAHKALKGEYGKLEDWQYKAYKYALLQEANVDGVAWVTSYGPWEGFMFGEACAFGYGCSDSTAAANLIPSHYYVLIELPGGWEVRRIEDRGAKRNDFLAQRKGAQVWIDRWVRTNEGSYLTRYASIRAFKTW